MSKLKKKLLLIFGTGFATLVAYRTVQFMNWRKGPDSTVTSKVPAPKIFVRKLHVTDDTISQPSEYKMPMINTKPTILPYTDTLFLLKNKRELLEFEIIADPSIAFSDVSIIGENKRKPHINKREDCFYVEGNRALFAFRPWVSDPDLNGNLSAKVVGSSDVIIPIKVLTTEDYNKYISNRLSVKQRNIWKNTISKYQKRLSNSWESTEFGKGRKSYYVTSLSPKRFFGKRNFQNGKYAVGEYFIYEGDYKITLFTGNNPEIIVEPINLML